jgi:ribose-phosphate pyrophosphokinase
MKIFSGTADQKLTNRICEQLQKTCGCELGPLRIDKFSDSEILPMFKESIRDEDVFFVQSTASAESIVETLLVIDAAKRAGCKSFTLIAPYMGYSRQDKTDHLRSSIGSKVLADILEKVGMLSLIHI